jgi:hypothetical protein
LAALADLFTTYYRSGHDSVDFASIRLHYTGADPFCRALRARAFTVGPDIYFADGAFAPHTRAGLWLLAHEVAHVVQQSARETSAPGPLSITAAWTPQERAADAAADSFMARRPCVIGATSATSAIGPVVQRYMAWEHAMLGDLTAGDVQALTARDTAQIRAYRELLEELGNDPRGADEERLRARYAGLETLRLPGSGLVMTLGELNVLPDYLGHPREIETAPAAFMEPLIQSVRSWSIAELRRSAGQRRSHRRLPGAMRYALLGGLTEAAEVPAIGALGKRSGFAPSRQYPSVLARNAGHFAPLSWRRWRSFHHMSRELIEQSAAASEADRETLRRRARIYAGYADHFLQDSFAAGHLINKTLVMQWYIEWLAENGISYPHSDVLAAMTVARQPLLHGPGHYDRDDEPCPPWDPQDLADAPATTDRVAASGLITDATAHTGQDEQDAYAAYLTMLGSGTVQFAAKVVHEYLNKHSLVVASAPDGPRFRLFGDHTLLASGDGAWHAAQAATASRRAISELLHDGETTVSSRDISDSFPRHVEQNGQLITLEEWHRTGLRDLCFHELFRRRSTRATRVVISRAFDQLGSPMDDLRHGADTAHARRAEQDHHRHAHVERAEAAQVGHHGGGDRGRHRLCPGTGDADHPEAPGPLGRRREHLGDQSLVDRQVDTEPDAENRRSCEQDGPSRMGRDQQRGRGHHSPSQRDRMPPAPGAIRVPSRDHRRPHHRNGVQRQQEDQALLGRISRVERAEIDPAQEIQQVHDGHRVAQDQQESSQPGPAEIAGPRPCRRPAGPPPAEVRPVRPRQRQVSGADDEWQREHEHPGGEQQIARIAGNPRYQRRGRDHGDGLRDADPARDRRALADRYPVRHGRGQTSLHGVHANLYQAPARCDLRHRVQASHQAQRRRGEHRAAEYPRPAPAEPGHGAIGQRPCQRVHHDGDDGTKAAHPGEVDDPVHAGDRLNLVRQQHAERTEVRHEQAQVRGGDRSHPAR